LVGAILHSKDPRFAAALATLRELTKDEPEPEYAMLHLAAVAQRMSFDSGVDWPEAAEYLIQKFKERDNA
jgi:hypothetical protein